MGERTQYAPGTFCWTDLTTTDQAAAKAFYGALFGWEAQDMPVGEGIHYSMMRLDGKDVAAISPQPPQQRDAGVPPVWNSYVAVESADAAANRAQELGASVHAPPFDVLEAGRMAVHPGPPGRLLPGVASAKSFRRRTGQHARRAGLERACLLRPRRLKPLLQRPLRLGS